MSQLMAPIARSAIPDVDLNRLASLFIKNRTDLERIIARRLDRRVSQRVDVADILQDGYITAAHRFREFVAHQRMPLLTWVKLVVNQQVLVVHRHHFSAKKRDARRVTSLRDSSVTAPTTDANDNMAQPWRALIEKETLQRLRHAISSLAADDQEIIDLRHYRGLSNRQAAIELGLSKDAASKRYIRALRRLKRRLLKSAVR